MKNLGAKSVVVSIGLLLNASLAFAASKPCELNGQVPIEFGNLDKLEDWHNEPDALYIPGVMVTRSQFGRTEGMLYVSNAERGAGKDRNMIGDMDRSFVFKDGKWQQKVGNSENESFLDVSEPLPLAFKSRLDKNGKADQVRVVAFIESSGNRLIICPAVKRVDNQKVNDIPVTRAEVETDYGKPISKKIAPLFRPDCQEQKISIWPRLITDSEYVVDVESLSSKTVVTIHVPREGEIKNEMNKLGKRNLLLDLNAPVHFISDCQGVRRENAGASNSSDDKAAPTISEKPK